MNASILDGVSVPALIAPEDIFLLIPARGGSKGLPGKNLKPLAGRPLIQWTIDAALRSEISTQVWVSTDDPEIAQVARQSGAEAPFLRPAPLASDTASTLDVALHALDYLKASGKGCPNYVGLLQPTSPLRTPADLRNAVQLLQTDTVDAVVSVTPEPHPVQWLRRLSPEGMLTPWLHDTGSDQRQGNEPLFRINGAIYLVRTAILRSKRTFFPERTRAYVMPIERSVDIDTLWDFQLAEMILRGCISPGA